MELLKEKLELFVLPEDIDEVVTVLKRKYSKLSYVYNSKVGNSVEANDITIGTTH